MVAKSDDSDRDDNVGVREFRALSEHPLTQGDRHLMSFQAGFAVRTCQLSSEKEPGLTKLLLSNGTGES